mmetsp:Transcript_5757/g.9811  ORF Transcript_5757/g.9811 Transcript_5757/m.9811 type:complete len:87 (-) Transcript_5757:2103-2363(-)
MCFLLWCSLHSAQKSSDIDKIFKAEAEALAKRDADKNGGDDTAADGDDDDEASAAAGDKDAADDEENKADADADEFKQPLEASRPR